MGPATSSTVTNKQPDEKRRKEKLSKNQIIAEKLVFRSLVNFSINGCQRIRVHVCGDWCAFTPQTLTRACSRKLWHLYRNKLPKCSTLCILSIRRHASLSLCKCEKWFLLFLKIQHFSIRIQWVISRCASEHKLQMRAIYENYRVNAQRTYAIAMIRSARNMQNVSV